MSTEGLENRLIQTGILPTLANEVAQKNVLKNHVVLRRALQQIPTSLRSNINEPWQVMCMSGEITALRYAINQYDIKRHTTDDFSRTPLHFLALSGVTTALDEGIKLLEARHADLHMKDKDGRSLVHYAAWSTSRCMLTHVIHALGLYAPEKDKHGRTITHYAAWSGSPKQLLHTLQYFDRDIGIKDDDSSGIEHYAAMSNRVAQLVCVNNLKLHMNRKDDKGRTILHFAALSDSLSQLLAAMELYGIDLKIRDNDGMNIMHYAAWSGVPEKLAYVIDRLKFDPNDVDYHGRTAMHFAAWSGVFTQIDYVLQQLKLNPEVTDTFHLNGYWYALRSPTHFFANNRIREIIANLRPASEKEPA